MHACAHVCVCVRACVSVPSFRLDENKALLGRAVEVGLRHDSSPPPAHVDPLTAWSVVRVSEITRDLFEAEHVHSAECGGF